MPDVWPFVPQRAFSERLEWKTDVIRSRSAEQRISIRNVPRTKIEHDYHFLDGEAEAARNILSTVATNEFLFPLWSDGQEVGALSVAQQNITIDTTQSRYKVGSFAFIIGGDGNYEVIEILSVAAGTLGLVNPYLANEYSNALVCPCLSGHFDGPLRIKKPAATYIQAEATLLSADDLLLTGANPYPSHGAKFVMSDRPLVFGSDTHVREAVVFPNFAGPMFKSPSFTFTGSTTVAAWVFHTPAEVWNFRLWLYFAQGKLVSFYMPLWTRDFVPVLPIGVTDTKITVERNPIADDNYLGPITVVSNGVQYYKNVLSLTHISPTQTELNLDEQFGTALTVASIELICRMPLMRFNSDAFEFGYQAGGSVTMRAALIEVPE